MELRTAESISITMVDTPDTVVLQFAALVPTVQEATGEALDEDARLRRVPRF